PPPIGPDRRPVPRPERPGGSVGPASVPGEAESGLRGRQLKTNAQARPSRPRFGVDAAAVELDNAPADSEPEAGAAGFYGLPGRGDPDEALKDHGALVRRKPGSVVL